MDALDAKFGSANGEIEDNLLENATKLNIPQDEYILQYDIRNEIITYRTGRHEIGLYSLREERIKFVLTEMAWGFLHLTDGLLITFELPSVNQIICLWEKESGTLLKKFKLGTLVFWDSFKRVDDEKFVAIHYDDGRMKLFKITCETKIRRFKSGKIDVYSLDSEKIKIEGMIVAESEIIENRIYLITYSDGFHLTIFDFTAVQVVGTLDLTSKVSNAMEDRNHWNISVNEKVISISYLSFDDSDKYRSNCHFKNILLEKESLTSFGALRDVQFDIFSPDNALEDGKGSFDDAQTSQSIRICTLNATINGGALYINCAVTSLTTHNSYSKAQRLIVYSPFNDQIYLNYYYPTMTNENSILLGINGMKYEYQDFAKGIAIRNRNDEPVYVCLPESIKNISSSHDVYGPPRQDLILQDAYVECIEQGKSSLSVCENIISFEQCKSSFDEMHAAHRILNLAIQDSKIKKGPHHKTERFKWRESIYKAGKYFDFENDKDDKNRRLYQALLMEAKENRVIDSVDAYFESQDIAQSIRGEQSKMFELGKHLLERILNLEAAHIGLRAAFERYKLVQGMAATLGIALNLLPIVGGATANMITAGAEIMEGVAVGDVVEKGMQVGIDVMTEGDAYENRLLRYIGNRLDTREIARLKIEEQQRLVCCIRESGTTEEVLKQILLGAAEGKFFGVDEIEDSIDIEEEDEGDHMPRGDVDGSSTESGGIPILPEIREAEAERDMDGEKEESFDVNEGRCGTEETNWNLEQLKKRGISTSAVKDLSAEDCAHVIAGYIVQYDDNMEGKFRDMQKVLKTCFMKSVITGSVLTKPEQLGVSNEELIESIHSSIKELFEDTIGRKIAKGRIEMFLREVKSNGNDEDSFQHE